jgi:hypothetical protein
MSLRNESLSPNYTELNPEDSNLHFISPMVLWLVTKLTGKKTQGDPLCSLLFNLALE